MPYINKTATGPNYLQQYDTEADLGRASVLQAYDSQSGPGTVFTLPFVYIPGTNTLWVFVNGQRAKLEASPSAANEYAETNAQTVTFGAALLASDTVEFIIAGAYRWDQTDFNTAFNAARAATPMGAYKNRIINGDFKIAQRGTSFTGLTNGGATYTLDRWEWAETGAPTAVMDVKQTTDHPYTPNGYCVEIDITTAQASPAADDACIFQQRIEGQNLQDLRYGAADAVSCTISFWAKSAVTGTFPLAIYCTGVARSYVTSYTITAADTWEYFSIVIPGDTSGNITNDNTERFKLTFALLSGSNDEAPSFETWGPGADYAYSGLDQIAASASGNLRIAELQLEVGSVATPFEQRPYGVERMLCERYYWRGQDPFSWGNRYGAAGNTIMAAANLKPQTVMRDVPHTVAIVSAPNYQNCTSDDLYTTQEWGAVHRVIVTATGKYRAYGGTYELDAEL